MRYDIEDTILICDDEIDPFVAEKFAAYTEKNKSFEDGIVGNTPDSENKYRVAFINNYKKNIEKSSEEVEFFNHLLSLNLLPILPDHDIIYVTKVHEMRRGGKMAWHNDGSYSLAISYYLSDCVGGELEVIIGSNNEGDIEKSIRVRPKINRIVIMKGDNQHRVLPVKSGKRRSIQMFVDFYSREETPNAVE